MVKAKEALDGVSCIAGNVAAVAAATGHARQVTEYCRTLIGNVKGAVASFWMWVRRGRGQGGETSRPWCRRPKSSASTRTQGVHMTKKIIGLSCGRKNGISEHF
jgi:hypothetical protein